MSSAPDSDSPLEPANLCEPGSEEEDEDGDLDLQQLPRIEEVDENESSEA